MLFKAYFHFTLMLKACSEKSYRITEQSIKKPLLTLCVPDESYSRNMLCTLNLISTFLFV